MRSHLHLARGNLDRVVSLLQTDGQATGPVSSCSSAPAAVRYWMCTPEIAREITRRWISEVPSKIV